MPISATWSGVRKID